jgi:hypothetical protein
VQSSPIDEHRALATLSNAGTTVSLEFRFNEANDVSDVHTPGRWSRSADGYNLTPWEGHFGDYRRYEGMLVPSRGEVGWYSAQQLQIVWKGRIDSIEYQFEKIQR